MIEKLKDSGGSAFGFKVSGQLDSADIATISPQIEFAMQAHTKPIGLLADLSSMHGATFSARWAQMRFLQHHTTHISRMAIVCDDTWEEVAEMILVASAVLQAETFYFHTPELLQAWAWVRNSSFDDRIPIRIMYPGKGLFQNYTPEFTGI
jgi:hypothetical protein